MNKTPTVLMFVALAIVLGVCIWEMQSEAVMTKNGDDIDNTIIGDSATDNHSTPAPAYMNSNWAWPMPLSLWNPVSTVRQ